MLCNNALYPDLYGHYREAKFTQTKHHWWWKANRVFNQLEVTRNHTGMCVEEHAVINLLILRFLPAGLQSQVTFQPNEIRKFFQTVFSFHLCDVHMPRRANSSVHKVSGCCGLDDWGSLPSRGKNFSLSSCPDQLWCSSSLLP